MTTFVPGQLYRRTELHNQYGGQRQGGISTPAKAPFVMLITGESGKQHGYRDEWTEDGHFNYTGEGQIGDMKFVAGNRAIRDHEAGGKTLHLFEQDKKDKRYLRYLGEMKFTGHHMEQRPDTKHSLRQAIVFHLRPVEGTVADTPTLEAVLAPEVAARVHRKGGGFGSPEHNRKVEAAAIREVRKEYETQGWTVQSREREKVGYDLFCTKGNVEDHVEVKGTQGQDVAFIITAGEVRNAMLDRRHVTVVVTDALGSPALHRYDKERFVAELSLEPLAYRAVAKRQPVESKAMAATKS